MRAFQISVKMLLFPWARKGMIIHTFYNDFLYPMRMNLDPAAGGTLMNSPQDVACNLIEDMVKNHNSWGNTQEKMAKAPQKGMIYEVWLFDHMNAKVDTLYQKIKNLRVTPFVPTLVAYVAPATLTVIYCEVYGLNGHSAGDCQMILVRGSTNNNINYVNN